jgi:hypothetical protein
MKKQNEPNSQLETLLFVKIKDCNPGAIVNRELSSRVRPIANLVSHHKSVVKNDIKLAMRILQNMDQRWGLWQEPSKEAARSDAPATATEEQPAASANESAENQQAGSDAAAPALTAQQQESNDLAKLEEQAFSKIAPTRAEITHKFRGPNPLLENITDYLVEEVNAEEEELLGDNEDGALPDESARAKKTGGQQIALDTDRKLNRVLDRLVLYLRIVHSIDYYNSAEYQQEDHMPNRCGIIFVRPSLPANAASASLKTSQDEISSYEKQLETKLKPYLEFKERIDVDMAKKLGIKDQRDEIEKFIKVKFSVRFSNL